MSRIAQNHIQSLVLTGLSTVVGVLFLTVAGKVIDKVGAGDTLLAVISILLYNKCDIDVSLFVASVCAAESVESIGNSNTLNLNYTLKRIEHMLK